MNVTVQQANLLEVEADAVAVNLFEGVEEPGGALRAVDDALGGEIQELIASKDFTGKLGDVYVLRTRGALPAPRVVITGLGAQDDFDLENARVAAAAAARKLRDLKVERYATIVHGAGAGGLEAEDAAQATVEGSLLGLYRYVSRKRNEQARDAYGVQELLVIEADESRLEAVGRGVRIGHRVAEATVTARDLVNEPGNYMTPTLLARRAREVAEDFGLTFRAIDEQGMDDLDAGAFVAVSRGSDESGQFIILEHNAAEEEMDTIVLVGKAVTFDTGGISIKPSANMWKMKGDMGGGAAVIGAMQAIAALNLPLRVIGLIPAVENMPGPTAYKPGDVVRAMNGKTIEIISTDAEGRMILADALCYAARYEPKAVVDLATLTGAITVALGDDVAGYYTDDEQLRLLLRAASDRTGDLLWEMPLQKAYRKQIDTQVADMKNAGGRAGGSITAALFLKEFTNYPWAHIDMAGPVLSDEQRGYTPKGGSGYGVRVLVEMLRNWGSES